MNICGYYPESINEGEGLRAVLFLSGCMHGCKGCFSKRTWSFRSGEPFDNNKQSEILQDLAANPLLQGITLCGGDPFFSAAELIPFITQIRTRFPHFDIWSYTGFTFEQLTVYEQYMDWKNENRDKDREGDAERNKWRDGLHPSIPIDIKSLSDRYQLLTLCDVIIDGKFVEEQRDLTLLYRGSTNQRIIDVRTSIGQQQAVLWTSASSPSY